MSTNKRSDSLRHDASREDIIRAVNETRHLVDTLLRMHGAAFIRIDPAASWEPAKGPEFILPIQHPPIANSERLKLKATKDRAIEATRRLKEERERYERTVPPADRVCSVSNGPACVELAAARKREAEALAAAAKAEERAEAYQAALNEQGDLMAEIARLRALLRANGVSHD